MLLRIMGLLNMRIIASLIVFFSLASLASGQTVTTTTSNLRGTANQIKLTISGTGPANLVTTISLTDDIIIPNSIAVPVITATNFTLNSTTTFGIAVVSSTGRLSGTTNVGTLAVTSLTTGTPNLFVLSGTRGALTGSVVLTGSTGINITGSTILNTGVTSLTVDTSGRLVASGTTGALTLSSVLTASTGISISGTTILNTGVTSLTMTGANPFFNVSGTTGAMTLTAATTGSPQFLTVGLGTSATTGVSFRAVTTVSNGDLISIKSGTTNFSGYFFRAQNNAGSDLAYLWANNSNSCGLYLRNNNTDIVLDTGSAGGSYFRVYGAVSASRPQIQVATGSILSFATTAETVTGNVGLVANTAGVLTVCTITSVNVGTLQTGGFGGNFRALATSTALSSTDWAVSLTGGITCTLPNATTLTGRQIIAKNIDSITGTITGTASQVLDGNTTMSVPASSSLRLISTGTNWISY